MGYPSGVIDSHLADLGIALAPVPLAACVPGVVAGGLLCLSGAIGTRVGEDGLSSSTRRSARLGGANARLAPYQHEMRANAPVALDLVAAVRS